VPLHYAVLAQVSLGYSPPEGRLPTCYSPGRHSTYPRKGFRVRLACVRHAASVDSEPGSNSQLKSWPSLSLSRKMTVLFSVTPAKLSERLVRFTHYLVFKDRLSAFACCEQTLIIPNNLGLSTSSRLLFYYYFTAVESFRSKTSKPTSDTQSSCKPKVQTKNRR
jgi:hypothetical protein